MSNADFPRILLLLRNERKLSQKLVAEQTGITQAVLSHYEKGKRECGLDFLVRAADFYNVSTDFLLGRSASRNGAVLVEDALPDVEAVQKANSVKGNVAANVAATLSRKMLTNSIDVIFELLIKMKNRKLISAISEFLTLSVYTCFRLTHRVNKRNDPNMFGVGEEFAMRAAEAGRVIAEGKAAAEADAKTNSNAEELPIITTASLEADYNRQASALMSLVKNAEHRLKKLSEV